MAYAEDIFQKEINEIANILIQKLVYFEKNNYLNVLHCKCENYEDILKKTIRRLLDLFNTRDTNCISIDGIVLTTGTRQKLDNNANLFKEECEKQIKDKTFLAGVGSKGLVAKEDNNYYINIDEIKNNLVDGKIFDKNRYETDIKEKMDKFKKDNNKKPKEKHTKNISTAKKTMSKKTTSKKNTTQKNKIKKDTTQKDKSIVKVN